MTTEVNSDDAVTAHELQHRPHSLRSHEPEEYREAIEVSGKAEVRVAFNRLEGGRFKPMLSAVHKVYAALDPDERDQFWRDHTKMMEWASVWGLAEDLRDFSDERPDDL